MNIELEHVFAVGHDLARPECVLATAGGYLYCSDWRGGVSVIAPDGRQRSIIATEKSFTPRPNGIALLKQGWFLLCHLGDQDGGVFILEKDGALSPFLIELDGEHLPPTNYAHVDHHDRVWITVSTQKSPRAKAYRPDVSDGFIVVVDERGARVVADELGYTNECCVSPDGEFLYVNETFARRLSRFAIRPDGALGHRQTVTEFGHGTFPDGLAFDEDGAVWITSIVSNRVIRVLPDGTQHVILEDSDPEHMEWTEQAFLENKMGRPHLDKAAGQRLRNISSLAFAGPDRKTAYLGCLLDTVLYRFNTGIAGWKPAHWHFPDPLS